MRFHIFQLRRVIWRYDWYSQLCTGNLNGCEMKAWKNVRPERDSKPWPLQYRCGALPTELKPTGSWGPFLERPGNLTGPESYFEIEVSRKVGWVLTSIEIHFVSLADNFTVQFSKLLKRPSGMKTKQLNGPGNYWELQEMGPWSGHRQFCVDTFCPRGSELTCV